MNKPPENLQAMLKRALTAQIEMGVGELVIDRQRFEKQCLENQRMVLAAEPETKHVVSVGEAVLMTGSPRQQEGINLDTEPQYGSTDEHNEAICNCTLCPLGQTRTKFVYGVGNPNADLMFVGEAPGADEDRTGEPFVGRAGKLLDKIIQAMGLTRDQVYIANILKCRPPGNRDPQPDEMNLCFPYLREQVRLIKPRLICALGRIATQALLDTKTPLGKLRGQWHEYEGVPMRATYHPAALLRFASYKKETWIDMQEIMARLKELQG